MYPIDTSSAESASALAGFRDRARFKETRASDIWRARISYLSVFAIGAVAICQVYHAEFLSGFDLFPGPRGDTRLSAYLVEHWFQVLSGHAAVVSPAMFYPVRGTLGYSDLYVAFMPFHALLRAFGVDLFHALAFTVILFAYLNFVCCFILLRAVMRCNLLASTAGALFFALNSPRLAQGDHLQLQPVFLLPVALGFLISPIVDSRRSTNVRVFVMLAASALCVSLQLLTSFYIGWFFLLWLNLLCVVMLLVPESRRLLISTLRRHRVSVVAAAVVFLVSLLPFFAVYWRAVRTVGGYGVLPQYIPEPKSFLLMADGNYVWDWLTTALLQRAGSGPDWGRRVGIGLVPTLTWVAVSVYAVSTIWQKAHLSASVRGLHAEDQQPQRTLFLPLVIATNLTVLVGLQYRGHTLWPLIHHLYPAGTAIRAVARYMIVLALPMSIVFASLVHCATCKLNALASRRMRRTLHVGLVALVSFGLFEQLASGDGQYFSISAENARLARLAAKLPDGCAAFYVTASAPDKSDGFRNQNYMHDAMLVSSMRHIPTLNGRSGNDPPGWRLGQVTAPTYENDVRRWVLDHRVTGTVCRLNID